MSDNEHRPGVREINLVLRHLQLEIADPAQIAPALAEIDQLFGLDAVSFDAETQVLNLAYDATHLNLDSVEELLSRHNIYVGHGWWTHFKQGYYKYVDQNIKDNASHEPWSCHTKPPTHKR